MRAWNLDMCYYDLMFYYLVLKKNFSRLGSCLCLCSLCRSSKAILNFSEMTHQVSLCTKECTHKEQSRQCGLPFCCKLWKQLSYSMQNYNTNDCFRYQSEIRISDFYYTFVELVSKDTC